MKLKTSFLKSHQFIDSPNLAMSLSSPFSSSDAYSPALVDLCVKRQLDRFHQFKVCIYSLPFQKTNMGWRFALRF